MFDWLSGPGFAEYFHKHHGWQWGDAHEYRQRYLTAALQGLRPVARQ